MTPWRVAIVEDDVQMREFLAASLRDCDRLALVASLGSVAEACAWLDWERQRPVDVMLVDLGLPDGSGLEVIRHARERHPECEPLVFSVFGDEDNVLASIEAGAMGYIHKDAAPENIAGAILEMKAGASPISPMIARRVLARYKALLAQPSTHSEPQAQAPEAGVSLSSREQELLELFARGFSYVEISRLMGVSLHTVQAHVKNLYRKLAVRSRSEAVFEATRLGLLSLAGGR
jgi:DNA-binding NarL/FixJ family response regulator